MRKLCGMELCQANASYRKRFFGLLPSPHERRDPVRLREEEILEPPVERLPAWSMLALAQGVYYAVFGAWPLVHLKSFETVTGPKREEWLTKGVGACWLNVGLHLVEAGRHGGRGPPARRAAAGRGGRAH